MFALPRPARQKSSPARTARRGEQYGQSLHPKGVGTLTHDKIPGVEGFVFGLETDPFSIDSGITGA